MGNTTLYEQLNKLIDDGDESKVIEFLKSNINNFSKEVQDKIIMSFFEEAVLGKAKEEVEIRDIQSDLLEKEKFLEKYKHILDDAEKIAHINESI